jgi:hypothetical protein
MTVIGTDLNGTPNGAAVAGGPAAGGQQRFTALLDLVEREFLLVGEHSACS